MAEFGTGKTIFILAIVVGCFAILWPKIFYPMLISSINGDEQPSVPMPDATHASSSQCCDVITEKDVNAIKVLTEMCGHILHTESSSIPGHLSKKFVEQCRDEVLTTCGLDIAPIIKDNVRLTKNYKQILDEIRSYNNSACLKNNFGVQFSLLGTHRQMRLFREKTARHLRPERPPHLHPNMLHPALREKGRAIPQQKPFSVGSVTGLDSSVPRHPGHPMPGMRPSIGGAGHVVPAPKGSSTMGIVMPLYTVGIVIFFVYTIMKMLFKKSEDRSKYPEFGIDPELRRMMFGAAAMEECATKTQHAAARAAEAPPRPQTETTQSNGLRSHSPNDTSRPSSKLVVTAISGLMAEVDQQILASEAKSKLNLKEEEGIESEELDETKISENQAQLEEEEEEADEEEKQDIEITSETKDELEPEMDLIEEDQEEDKQEEIIDDVEPIENQTHVESHARFEAEHGDEQKEAVSNGHVGAVLLERTTTPVQQLLEEGSGTVRVLGMETTAQCEGGQRWTGRPPTPDTPPRSTTPLPLSAIEQFVPPPPPPPHYRWARPPTPPTPPRSTTPLSHIIPAAHSYLLENAPGVLPGGQHGILVADSECEAVPVTDTETEDEDSPPVILSGKMTLSVISLPDTPAPPEHQQQSSAPESPALPRRVMHVEQPQTQEMPVSREEIQHQEQVPEERVKEETVNGTDNIVEEEGKMEGHLINGGSQQDEITATNYTTASAAAAEETGQGERQEETSADISGIDDEHAETADNDEPDAEVEDLPDDEDEEFPENLHGQSNGML